MNYVISLQLLDSCRTWSDLARNIGIHPRNDRALNKIKAYVGEHFLDCHLLKRTRFKNHIKDDDFRNIVETSKSFREVIRRCGLVAAGAAYKAVHNRIDESKIDTSHFLGKAINRGQTLRKKPIEIYLCENGPKITSHKLKLRLI